MANTLVLRFSNYEYPAVEKHRELLAAKGAVWWGWWKKQHESGHEKALTEAAQSTPLKIGLVNRSSGACYEATCDSIVRSIANETMPSPDPELTPAYYRSWTLAAWFRLTNIRDATVEEFKSYGGIPVGDPTLYIVNRSKRRAKPSTTAAKLRPTRIPGESILHLSDLHFGTDHGFRTTDQQDPVVEASLATLLTGRILKSSRRIGLVIVSGDLITAGDANGYAAATHFLGDLLAALKLEPEHVVIVPGNHDIKLRDNQATRDFEHETSYRNFLRSFYAEDRKEIENFRVFQTRGGWTYNVVALNSSRPRTAETMDYGYVGEDRYAPLLEALQSAAPQGSPADAFAQQTLNIGVLHHHLLPANLVCKPESKRPVSLTLDAGQIVSDFQSAGIHFALHGHQHIPWIGSTGRLRAITAGWAGLDNQLFVIGGGSAGVRVDRLWDEMRDNAYGVYTPSATGLDVLVEQYNKAVKPKPYIEVTLPYSRPHG